MQLTPQSEADADDDIADADFDVADADATTFIFDCTHVPWTFYTGSVLVRNISSKCFVGKNCLKRR